MNVSDVNIIALLENPSTLEKGVKAMMDAYQSRLYWHIRRIVTDQELAKDTLQDTFIKAYQNFAQFNKNSTLYTWLYRIATNEALQQLKKQKKMQKTDESADFYLMNKAAENVDSNADEIQIVLENAIEKLPEKQKLVFIMRYYDDLPYQEISTLLDLNVGTLKTNYHFAKQKIEEHIKLHLEKSYS